MSDIVHAWIAAAEQDKESPGSSSDNWAIQKLIDMHFDGRHEEVWAIILEIVRATESQWVLECLGAGPLEDLLRVYANQYIERIAAEAAASPKFKTALSAVWLDSDDTYLYKRIYEICGIAPPFD